MTDGSSRQGPAETEASLRAKLRGQIEAAQAELSAKIAQLKNAANADSGLIAQGEAQLGALAALQGQVDSANPMALAMMSAQIAASVAAANTLTQQAQAASTTAQAAVAAEQLAIASKAARETVTSFEEDFYKRKIFDDDLKFQSDDDRKAYRAREEERKRAIDEALAKHTPEGDLEANQLSIDQLKDAGAHGADKSPDYQPTLNRLETSRAQLGAAIDADSQAKESASRIAALDATPPAPSGNFSLPAEVIAKLQKSGVANTDSAIEGHGVSVLAAAVRAGQSPA